jgi:hypothetical protein
MRSFLRPHTRFMLAFWPGLLALLLVLRLFLGVTEGLVPLNNIWQKSRIRQGLDAVASGAVAPRPGSSLLLMVGASESLLAFQPLRFDELSAEAGRRVTSFNLSFQNTGTMLPLYFARLRKELLRSGMQPRVILVSIPLPRLTLRAREAFFSQARYHDIDSVFFEPGLWSEAGLSSGDKLVLLFNKWVLGERSLVQLQRTFVQLSRSLLPWARGLRASAAPFYREEIHPNPAWSAESRGGYYLNIESRPDLAEEVIIAARKPRAMSSDLQDLIRCCDVLELRLDEPYVREVIEGLRGLRDVAAHVALVSYPESPRLRRPPAAEGRAREAFERIAREAGAQHLDAKGAGLTDDDYFDLSHLTPGGVEKFNRFLARALPSEWLAEASQ